MSDSFVGNTIPNDMDFAPAYKKSCKEGNRWTIQNTIAGAGAVKSNLKDMTVLLETMLKPEQSSLSEAIGLATEERIAFDENTKIGFGWMTTTTGDNSVLWHNGGTGSFATFMGVNKAKNRGLVLMFNKPLYDEVTATGFEFLNAD